MTPRPPSRPSSDSAAAPDADVPPTFLPAPARPDGEQEAPPAQRTGPGPEAEAATEPAAQPARKKTARAKPARAARPSDAPATEVKPSGTSEADVPGAGGPDATGPAAEKPAAPKKPATKKSAAGPKTAKKAAAKKTTAKKTTPDAAKKPAAKKADAKKPAARKAGTRKPAATPTAPETAPAAPSVTGSPAAAAAPVPPAQRPAAGAGTPEPAAVGARAAGSEATASPVGGFEAGAAATAGARTTAAAAQTVGGAAAPAAPGGVLPAPPLGDGDRGRLLSGTHHDPHALLGAHPVRDGVLFRVLRPYAKSVTVVAEGLRVELPHEGDGIFAGVLPLSERPDYRLAITYGEGPDAHEVTVHDPYRFLPAIGELDLHLIGEGRHEELWQALGARVMEHEGVPGTRFTVWAPNAQGVRVAGNMNYWDGTVYPMRSLGSTGVWELFIPGLGEGELYKFDIARPDGSHTLRIDPMARRTECPPANASVIDVSRHEWGDADWMARRAERPVHTSPLSVYEVHLPSWRPGLSYRKLAEQLPAYVKDLGFTHVELMPVAEHPFGGSWGYQVTGFYAPTARLGSPDDFKYLVDALHRAGIGVIMDWVPAHFPRDDWALAEFDGRPLYEHEDPARAAHPDWGTLEFDYGRTEVRNFLVANAVYWCSEFHIDGLRVDAVASMLYLDYSREHGEWTPNQHGGRENLDAVDFLQEMNATVYRRCPGVVTIAEESTAWDGVTRATHHVGPGGFGGLGFGLKWNMGWMHDSLVYMSKEPVHREYHHNEMTFSMVYAYSENYVLPISHDEVVHGKRALVSKMPGDWWQQRANHRAYLAFMWSHPGKQLLFMGQEFAQGAEWSEEQGPDWWLLDPAYDAAPDHRGVQDLVRELNRLYGATPALWERDTDPGGFAWIDGGAWEDNVFSFVRYDDAGDPLLAVCNFSPVVRHEYRLGVPENVPAWREVLNTDEERFGGSGVVNTGRLKSEPVPYHGRSASLAPVLPPLATIWLRPEG
ncbi:1,4-alpha-glucan branching enzyme [Streptomyces olivaceiscleroticus]|uniref:1,4-alpha-glucan branching enzyme GlgB n=1 Tax=Streptomyces olivaceiscleroticus TaxID=68245 RepID=A0ABP3KSM0_9ACTN